MNLIPKSKVLPDYLSVKSNLILKGPVPHIPEGTVSGLLGFLYPELWKSMKNLILHSQRKPREFNISLVNAQVCLEILVCTKIHTLLQKSLI